MTGEEAGKSKTMPVPSPFAYGGHGLPLTIKDRGISLSLQSQGTVLVYRRECSGEQVEKILSARGAEILINPVEPVNKPKEITPNLLIEFERPMMLEPEGSARVYVKYPVEIGVFVAGQAAYELLDVLTLQGQKYTLYGDPRRGVLCRYWRSQIYPILPVADPVLEGVMELDLTNEADQWLQVTKAVLSAYGMKIYFDEQMVAMKATMRLFGERNAETDFQDSPLREGMRKAEELYTSRRLLLATPKFVMADGI